MEVPPSAPLTNDGLNRPVDDSLSKLCAKMDQCLPSKFIQKENTELNYILHKEEEMLELQMTAPKTITLNSDLQKVKFWHFLANYLECLLKTCDPNLG